MPGEFLDSNVLIYAFTTDPRAGKAEALLAGDAVTSVQGLNEFANVARRKLGMTWHELKDALAALRTLLRAIHPIDLATHDRAIALAERHGFSVFDALIIASALEAGCSILHTEDMQHGMSIEGRLRISNPFAATP